MNTADSAGSVTSAGTDLEGDPRRSTSAAATRLDADQQRVVEHNDGPLLVLAGPGTGKTTTIVEAVAARLAERDNQPDLDLSPRERWARASAPAGVLVLTFGRAAANELRERVAARVGNGVLPTISTFHSFSYGLVREFGVVDGYGFEPRLIDAATQDSRLRELLTYAVREGRVPWPKELDAAIGTAGLATQVRELITRAQLLGFDAEELEQVARRAGMPVWESVARFFDEYRSVLDDLSVIDYSELINRAVEVASQDDVAATLQKRYPTIYVDEYQDTDPAQVALLQAMAGPSSTIVAVGDPDQAIYRFRGADVSGILRFPQEFPTAAGTPAPIAVLRHTRRFGPTIATAAGQVIAPVSLGSLPAEVRQQHRSPVCQAATDGTVEVLTFTSEMAQATAIADRIRRERLTGQLARWSDAAVLVRSAGSDLMLLQHALEQAGVPVDVVADDLPLHQHPSVVVILDAVRVALGGSEASVDTVLRLLASPLVGLDSIATRQLGRELRAALPNDWVPVPAEKVRERRSATAAKQAGQDDLDPAALAAEELDDVGEVSGGAAIRLAVLNDEFYERVRPVVGDRRLEPITRLRSVIGAAKEHVASQELVAHTLWAVWTATDWPAQLAAASSGNGLSARLANRDLDSVVALFAEAKRYDETFGGARPVQNFLLEISSLSLGVSDTGASRPQPDAVTLSTAHRAKGLQWPLVVVFGAQEDRWPDVRARSSLLLPERLTFDGIGAPTSLRVLMEDERRLFFVACTRAQERLIVTGVEPTPTQADAAQLSRFVEEVAQSQQVEVHRGLGIATEILSMSSMVASLRAALESPESSEEVRRTAAMRLALLAKQGVKAAHPDNWWGVNDWTANVRPVRDPAKPVAMSGSSWTQLDRCSMQWFLEHEAKAKVSGRSTTVFGSVIHELADAVTAGRVPADLEILTSYLRQIWPHMGFEADWQQEEEFGNAVESLKRFLDWHGDRPDNELLGSELPFTVEVDVPAGMTVLSGSIDRLERDPNGQIQIYDLKTQKKPEPGAKLATHRQLSLYKLAIAEGAIEAAGAGEATRANAVESVRENSADGETADGGSAEESVDQCAAGLVLLRVADGKTGLPKVQVQPPIDLIDVKASLNAAIDLIHEERFSPTKNDFCRFCNFTSVCPIQNESREVTS